MDLGKELKAIKPVIHSSPLPGFEYVRGYGIFALPFDSGHILALRVFPENDFASYCTVWHRSPEGIWAIYVDGPRIDTACPRYYGAATRHVAQARISVKWTGPMNLSIDMDAPRLQWNISIATTPLVRVMNAISAAIPERLWGTALKLRAFEQFGGILFDLGKVTLSGIAPNGHFSILMPRKMFPIASAEARLEGQDLGKPVRSPDNPSIGSLRLPARGIFAVGRGYFKIQDPDEYRRTVAELHSTTA